MSKYSLSRALLEAAKDGSVDRVEILLDRGAEIDADGNKLDCEGGTALMWAIRMGAMDVVTLLLDRGADIHAQNEGALRCAVEWTNFDAINRLIGRGALIERVDIKDLENTIDHDYENDLSRLLVIFPHIQPKALLGFTIWYNSLNCASVLFSLGARPNLKQRLTMTEEMREIFSVHQQKNRLMKKQSVMAICTTIEPGL